MLEIYLIPFVAVLLGYGIALLIKPKNKKNIKLLLAFSGSFLLALTVTHLLPEVYVVDLHSHENHSHNHTHSSIGVFIMIGIIFQIILEYFSKGAEHGHVHSNEQYKSMPWLLFVSLCLHALFEGIPINNNNNLALGIAIHHLPIAIILTMFLQQAKLPKQTIFIFMLSFAFMTPLGTFLAEKLIFLSQYYTQITGIVIGILFHISSTIIFESSEGHKFNLAKLLVIVLGVALASFM